MSAAAIVLATIVAATVVAVRQAVEATRQRDRALSLAMRNEAVIDFFTDMLTEVAPADQPVRVADLLERSQEILLGEEAIPEHRAAILQRPRRLLPELGQAGAGRRASQALARVDEGDDGPRATVQAPLRERAMPPRSSAGWTTRTQ